MHSFALQQKQPFQSKQRDIKVFSARKNLSQHKFFAFSAEHCDADNMTSDIIPIVVGACLAALVVIVLIAYLIGRARAKRTGYQSV